MPKWDLGARIEMSWCASRPIPLGKGAMCMGQAPTHILSTCALPSVVSLHQHEGMGNKGIVLKADRKHDACRTSRVVILIVSGGLGKMGTHLVCPLSLVQNPCALTLGLDSFLGARSWGFPSYL